MVDEDAESTVGPGPNSAHDGGEIVDAAEVFDDDALDAEVRTPHLFDEFGVVPALDVDAAGQRGPRAGPGDRDRTRCGPRRRRRRLAPSAG